MTDGLCVVGAHLGAGEGEVARALAPDSETAEPVALPGGLTPLVAARRAGTALEPAELVAAAGGAQVCALPGGPLAPLSPRYAVRDLARELGRPVVVAVAAHPGFPGQALGAVDALRATAVGVVAVVVAGWPDPPSRAQLDERDVLRELAGLPVETLRAGARLDPTGWMAAGEAPAAPVRPVTLEPYRAWEPRPIGDPRATPRPQIMAAVLELVGVEGPMTAARAYAVLNRAGGGRKLTSVARAPLSSAVYWLAREGRLALTRAEDAPWQGEDLLRLPDTPAVRVRELGPRTLDEVPVDEIAELVRRLRAARGGAPADAMKRAVLDAYGLVRLTAKADEYLGRALELSEG